MNIYLQANTFRQLDMRSDRSRVALAKADALDPAPSGIGDLWDALFFREGSAIGYDAPTKASTK